MVDFTEYFTVQYPRIVNELDYIVGDRELARDLAQEAFVRQHIKWSTVSQLDIPGAWVRKVAIRLAFRSMRRRFPFVRSVEEKDAIASTPPSEMVLDVRAAVRGLSDRQRAAVVLYYYRDLPILAVADAMNCSESTAKAHLHQARARLTDLLADYGPHST